MAINYPGPFEVRINYLTDEAVPVNVHQVRLSCAMGTQGSPGSPFTAWFPYQKGGAFGTSLNLVVDAFVLEMKKHYTAACTIQNAELWEYAPQTFDAVFRSAYAIAAVGTGSGTTRDAGQVIWTWRTAVGGVMKLDLRGSINASGVKVALPSTGNIAAMNTYMLASTTPWIGRDGGIPISGLFFLPGQNERSYKKLYR